MKNFFAIFTCVFVLSFLMQAQAQTQMGTFYFDTNSEGYALNKNEGTRTVEMEVRFAKPFESNPKIVLSLTYLDVAKDGKLRYSVSSSAISRDGFVLRAKVWGDTQLNAIGGNWIAYSE